MRRMTRPFSLAKLTLLCIPRYLLPIVCTPRPDTGDLALRVGIHSGPVTAGVLLGEKSRFQLFGDTVNTGTELTCPIAWHLCYFFSCWLCLTIESSLFSSLINSLTNGVDGREE